MAYIDIVPGLVCGLALCVSDVRRRRVPRAWVFAALAAQLVLLAVDAFISRDPWLVFAPVLYGVAAGLLQLLLARLARGSLGMGDVTCTWMVGQSIGMFGFGAFVLWWLAMGVLGLIWIGLWSIYITWRAHRRLSTKSSESLNDATKYTSKAAATTSKFTQNKAPFVPVIVLSAIIAIVITMMTAAI
ncbi:hypothetical protein [Bifidobacterium sp. ESL0790]|uniref:hypothetical protein n=1 Tax=Bifidobacterium sp. ESL0790 TaxID=2983233 RepID=UPI0023F93145|nr:hypothetical protein [Bifidobacterium sp. ESL0790]WEV73090.1 hypothetical protein OZY47_03860 [Bifidobacterium sp. ESL0790]